LKLDAYYNEVWIDLAKIIINDGLIVKALPFLQQAYKITGDIPGINYLLASFYINAGYPEKSFRHLSIALTSDKEQYRIFEGIFPEKLLTKKIKRLLAEYNLLP
jgi:tetratricopeptide (TPR) repeat protein